MHIWQSTAAAAAAKSLQSCPTLCDPVDYSLPGSSVHGILQARILDWVAISFSRIFPIQGSNPGLSASEADALTCEPPGFKADYNSSVPSKMTLIATMEHYLYSK